MYQTYQQRFIALKNNEIKISWQIKIVSLISRLCWVLKAHIGSYLPNAIIYVAPQLVELVLAIQLEFGIIWNHNLALS